MARLIANRCATYADLQLTAIGGTSSDFHGPVATQIFTAQYAKRGPACAGKLEPMLVTEHQQLPALQDCLRVGFCGCAEPKHAALSGVVALDASLLVKDEDAVRYGLEGGFELVSLLHHLPLKAPALGYVAQHRHGADDAPISGPHRRAGDVDFKYPAIERAHRDVLGCWPLQHLAAQNPRGRQALRRQRLIVGVSNVQQYA